VYAYIKNNEAKIRADIMADTYAKKSPAATYKEPQQLIDFVSGKLKSTKVPGYIDKIFGEISQYCTDCAKVDTDIELRIEQVISDLFCQAIGAVQQGFRNYMLRNNMLSYDELITRLHEALTSRDNPGLISSLREKYKSVFIDEFQDTDRLQYEIFHTVFGNETILFYIGDPKQSIYAFRTADIFTYFQAGKQVKHHYTMNTNYRSSKGFIDAMNIFFKPIPDFDTFHFGQAEDRIDYHRVDSPAQNAKEAFLKNGVAIAPMPLTEEGSKPKIMDAVVAQVIDLLSGGYSIRAKGKDRPVTPADIGILVRANNDGRQLKALLARFNIPAVNVNDDKILNSEEAPWMLYLLQAMLDPSKGSINRALKSPFTGLKTENILRLDDEKILTAFRHYREKWISEGIYSATATFMADFGVQSVLLDSGLANGDRMIANLLQLVELLHKVQSRRQLSPLELVNWFQRGIEGLELLGDEYEQRIESDEEAIRIVTIHKSKGLEYNIVLAPFLDFKISDKDNLLSFRNPETKSYRTIQRALRTAEHDRWVAEQTEQEHRRLVYVAITRAVYACYLYRSTANVAKNSTLSAFVDAIDYASTELIVKIEAPVLDNSFRYKQHQVVKTKASPEPVNFQLNENNWARMSYTMLAKKGEIVSRARASAQQEAFEDFMFRGLERGNKTGNLLHQIFENANFSNAERWPDVIAEALRQHAPKHLETYPPLLTELLDQICHAEINVDEQTLQLSQVNYEHRLHEFEFDFLVDQYNPYALNSLSTGEAEIRVGWDTPLQGILNGKMDLFFEYAGKYYVLDWKSNYLGDRLEDYSAAPLVNAMNENNYHLQYLIYTLAAKKYLETRLPQFDYGKHFGGVIYLFVRGVRRTGDAGIYVNVPKLETIQKLESILAGEVEV
jgi:exodeoxyribonuclease V beta subunit